jgi:hypothetical protein
MPQQQYKLFEGARKAAAQIRERGLHRLEGSTGGRTERNGLSDRKGGRPEERYHRQETRASRTKNSSGRDAIAAGNLLPAATAFRL